MRRGSPTAARLLAGAIVLSVPLAMAVRAQDGPGGTTSVQVSNEGKQVYEQICQSCHMADAKGGDGAGTGIPALAGNANLASKDFMLAPVVHGRGGMPWFTDMLSDEQIAAVATYVRSHFNAYPDPVTVADVARVKAASSTAASSSSSNCSCN